MTTEEMLSKYERALSGEGKTRTLYLKYAKDFLEASGGVFTREAINSYIEKLRKAKYSDGTVNFAFRVIRTLYKRNAIELEKQGYEWPFRRGETPQIREDRVVAPALHPDIITEMIESTRRTGLPAEKFYLALSTTYGPRRQELINITSDDINLKDRILHIDTIKHGRARAHAIPEEIGVALEGYDFEPVSEFELTNIWYRIEYRIGLKHTDQVGWHSVRRTLNTLLMDELPENVVMSFMRWKTGTSSNMTLRYTAQKFVGRDTTETRLTGDARDIDSKVFAVHPFIKYWAE